MLSVSITERKNRLFFSAKIETHSVQNAVMIAVLPKILFTAENFFQ